MKITTIAVLALMLSIATQIHAGTIVLDAVDRGWVANDGGSSGSITGNISYFVGDSGEFRVNNWFVFDLSGIGQPIISAELHLFNLVYVSSDPTETYTLFDVATDPAVLMSGLGGVPAFNDLGSGTIHGSYVASSADNNSTLVIPLNDAALGSLNSTLGMWATGGAITTLDNDIGTTEHLFTGTDMFPLNVSQLIITTIPAPAALPLLLMPAFFGRRRRS